jgi:hypothetical protein
VLPGEQDRTPTAHGLGGRGANVLAADRHDCPAATAATTRSRRSSESCELASNPARIVHHIRAELGIPPDQR